MEKEAGYLPGIRIARGVDPINHALFTDDSLLLGGASMRIAKDFDEVLKKFYQILDALINKSKNDVYGWNVDQSTIL